MNAKYNTAKKRFRDFIFAFSWFLASAVIANDLGFTKLDIGWVKYLGPTLFGMLYAFLIWPGMKERARQRSLNRDL